MFRGDNVRSAAASAEDKVVELSYASAILTLNVQLLDKIISDVSIRCCESSSSLYKCCRYVLTRCPKDTVQRQQHYRFVDRVANVVLTKGQLTLTIYIV